MFAVVGVGVRELRSIVPNPLLRADAMIKRFSIVILPMPSGPFLNPPFPPRSVANGGDRGAYIHSQWGVRIAARRDDQKGFEVQPIRWIMERTFAWLSRCRRLARNYEKTVSSAKGFIHFAMIRLMARRLAA